MAQRKQREAPEVVKARIEFAAIELFALRGADAVSVAQMASAVQMSAQAVLYHYGTKANLHEAVTARVLGITSGWLARFGTPDSLEVSVDGLTRLLLSFAADHPGVPVVILRELLRSPEVAQTRFQTETIQWRQRISDGLEMGKTAGVVRQDLDAKRWFDRIALMLLATLSFPYRMRPLSVEMEHELRGEVTEAVRIALSSVFVAPDPWLAGRGFEALAGG